MKSAGKMVGPLPDGSGIVGRATSSNRFGTSRAATPNPGGKAANNRAGDNGTKQMRHAGRGR